jgi:uncharacterized membrane protein
LHFDSSLDLAIFDQAVWHLSRFEAPASSIKGFASLFSDHFHPIIVTLAPLYWILPSAETLLVAQGLLLGASVVPVFLFLRRRLPWRIASAMSAAYGLFWGLQRAAIFDFHEMAFAPLAIAVAIDAMDRRSWSIFWIACAALALVKEDLIPVVMGLGLYLTVTGERARGAALTIGSIAAFFVVIKLVIPSFGDNTAYNYLVSYGDMMRRPWEIPIHLLTPTAKLRTIFLWLAPFAFLSLRSPLVLLIVPLALERFLSSNAAYWGTSFHYSAPMAPILAMSAGDGLARLTTSLSSSTGRTRLLRGFAAACVVLSSLLPGRQMHWRLFSPGPYKAVPFEATARQVLALIPADASVVAQTALLPHLSQRREIFILETGAPDAEYVVSSTHVSPWPLNSLDEVTVLTEERRRRGYTAVFEEDGWLLLRRAPTYVRSAGHEIGRSAELSASASWVTRDAPARPAVARRAKAGSSARDRIVPHVQPR